jgi:CRISPR/Cas system CSM-associated protein Csm2 small subunit
MKAFHAAIIIIFIVICFISGHAMAISRAADSMRESLTLVETSMNAENILAAENACAALERKFMKNSLWMHVTTDSKEARDVETSIQKIKILIGKDGHENLYAEIANLRQLLAYLPQREGFNLLDVL